MSSRLLISMVTPNLLDGCLDTFLVTGFDLLIGMLTFRFSGFERFSWLGDFLRFIGFAEFHGSSLRRWIFSSLYFWFLLIVSDSGIFSWAELVLAGVFRVVIGESCDLRNK